MIKVTNQSKPVIKIKTNGRLGVLKKDKHNQDHNKKIGPTFDDNHQEDNWERGVEPTLECLSKKNHDQDLLHTITIICTTQGENYIIIFFNKKVRTCNKHH